ncbi:MAG: hypothetical protein Q9162_003637 [Coniocarpon cinnabarinum]
MDNTAHPVDTIVEESNDSSVDIQQLRKAIPTHCFRPSYTTSLYYLCRDLLAAASIAWIAHTNIPHIPDPTLRLIAWAVYGWLEGLVFTGIWILGHECGHGAFSLSTTLNDTVGFLLHSALLTPYFSWQSSHRRHHIFANHMEKDMSYVPPMFQDYAKSIGAELGRLEELAEDAPFFTLLRLALQQLVGWPFYILSNVTAPPSSLAKSPSKGFLGNSHFAPGGSLFLPQEFTRVALSDVGAAITALTLTYAARRYDVSTVLLLYLQPYLWANHWIVAVTYLHHTHPNLPKFEPEAWTYMKGATATVDRDFGFIGRHVFHGVIEFHVIHHLFPKIPFYRAEEATQAVKPLLGAQYHEDRRPSYLSGLWEASRKCKWVAPDDPSAKPADRTLWYRAGPSPPLGWSMGRKLWTKFD